MMEREARSCILVPRRRSNGVEKLRMDSKGGICLNLDGNQSGVTRVIEICHRIASTRPLCFLGVRPREEDPFGREDRDP
jgi:hypothetical protein